MSDLPFSGLQVFLAVAEHGSLRKAADVLGVQPPAVSYRLKSLEERIGASLFVRTTRSVSLTDSGRALLARARPAITELGDAIEEARASGAVRKGAVRITVPYVAYELAIADKLLAFQEAYPEIELELSFDETFVDVVSEGFHAGVRLGHLVREDMIAVRLTPPVREVVFAAPSYLKRRGRPERPEDLLRHNCIRYRYIASRRFAEWQFAGPDGVTTIEARGNLIVDSTTALVSAVRAGVGIGWLFRPGLEEDFRAGRLESVLDEYAIERPGYFLYYPRANARIEAFRVFVAFMKHGGGRA